MTSPRSGAGRPGPALRSGRHGTTLKALIHEQFGDGIISAINFKLDVKVEDPEGGSRAVITLDGKYLPTKPF
ncbi:cyanate lyase [Planotetraspora sp. GP83]